MGPLYPKTHLFFSTLPSSTRRTVLLFFFLRRQPSLGSHSLSAPRGRRDDWAEEEEEEERRRRGQVKVSVWWDMESCGVPSGNSISMVGPAIAAAVRANDIRGPVEINAFGDVLHLYGVNRDCLSSTGINLSHVPRGGKNSTDQSVILNLMNWVSQNPPPAHIFLISGDKEMASTLHRLRMSNYNILLATPQSAHPVLCSASSIMWNWFDLLRGESLLGKCFNQPPDGPYSSWYGHYKMPLLDAFSSGVENRACLQSEESISDNDPQVVPESVKQEIHRIVESYTDGIHITVLRRVLGSAINLDKNYYGYRRLVPFLLSLDNIVKLRQVNSGHFVVHARDQVDKNVNAPSELSRDLKFVTDGDDKTPLLKDIGRVSPSPTSDENGKEISRNAQKTSGSPNAIEMADAHVDRLHRENEKNFENLGAEKVNQKTVEIVNTPESDNLVPHGVERIVEPDNVPESCSYLSIGVGQESASEFGLFRRVWTKWFGSNSLYSDESSGRDREKLEENDSSEDSKSAVGFTHGVPSSVGDPRLENIKPGFLDRVKNLFTSGLEANRLSDCSYDDEENLIVRDSRHELFSEDSFWSTMQSFMGTSQGSLIVSEQRSREHMAHELQKKGPECLHSLGEKDLLHLITILISEKKWVEERPSEVFPFKLSTRVKKNSEPEICHPEIISNSLSSIVTTLSPHSVGKDLPNHDVRETENGSPVSREKVLADCQKLLNDVLEENKNVYLSLFREHFFERFGYHLDYKKLGHPKLSSLLSTMPGVTIESNHIFSFSASSEKALPNHNVRETENGSLSSREKVLADCRKLLNIRLEMNKNGYLMALFGSHFLKRYGYQLDYKKLGYQKLSSLLSTMPGVTIKSNHIFSSSASSENTTVTDSSLSGKSTDSDDLDLFSEELGPVTHPTAKNNRPVGDLSDNNKKSEKIVKTLFDALSDAVNKIPDKSKVVHFGGKASRTAWKVQPEHQKRHLKKPSFASGGAVKDLAEELMRATMRDKSAEKEKDEAFRR